MTDLVVYRGLGTRHADTITEPLLSTPGLLRYRGTQEMDEYAQEYMTVDMTVIHRDGLVVGQLVRVAESIYAPYMYAKITDISYISDSQKTEARIVTRRPLIQ